MFIGKGAKGADTTGCGAPAAVKAIVVLITNLKSLECKVENLGQVVIVQDKDKVTLSMLICDGKSLVPFVQSDSEQLFEYTGKSQTYKVPIGVKELEVHLWGAGGGTGIHSQKSERSFGGAGAYLTATVPVKYGEVYTVVVGEGGRRGDVRPTKNSFGGGVIISYFLFTAPLSPDISSFLTTFPFI